MKRSFELLIAEAISRAGMIKDIDQAISHMNGNSGRGGYSAVVHKSTNDDAWTIVTVVFASQLIAVFTIEHEEEVITLVGKIGFSDGD